MVQAVLVVQEGLVVLFSESVGGKRERRVYFFIQRNIWAKSENKGQDLLYNPKSVLSFNPSPILGGLRGAQDQHKALWGTLLTEHILRAPS